MANLSNKCSLVTGGAKGIGRAITAKFIKDGAKVCVFDKDAKAIENLKTTYNNLYKGGRRDFLHTYHIDISNKKQIDELFKSGRLLNLDILVNNAGIDLDFSFENPDDSVWQKVINTNLNGSRYVTENVLKQMRKNNKRGSIIFITSVHNAQAFPNAAAYDSSKHALVGLMRNIALDYGKYGIRCNAVAPGSIKDAGRTQEISKQQEKEFCQNIPLGRLGLSEEIANVVAFLASDESSYIHGEQIRVDGGLPIKSALF